MGVDVESRRPANGHESRPGRRRIAAAAVAAGLCGLYLAAVELLILPAQERGVLQAITSPLCAVADILEAPGRGLLYRLGFRSTRHPSAALLALLVLVSVLLTLVATYLASFLLFPGRPAQSGGSSGLTRRRFLGLSSASALAGGAGLLGNSMLIVPGRLEVSRRSFALRGLLPSLDGLVVVQLTDLHVGPWCPLSRVRRWIEIVNELRPDLVLLTGDYVHRSGGYIAPAVHALSALRARIGVLAVLGNHDWYEDPTGVRFRREMAAAGIPLIDNARRFVTAERRLVEEATAGLCVAGVGDCWEDEVLFGRALAGVPPEMPRLLLSHNPDAAERQELRTEGHRIDLMLCGHTHGGQIRLPWLGAPAVPSAFGEKYAEGLVQGPCCPVFVCRGTGMTVLPLRFGATPEIAVIELRRATG